MSNTNLIIPFQTIDWSSVPTTQHLGETGMALQKTMQYDGLRLRMVEYLPGYKADHWCEKGHIIFCIKGEMLSHLKDGRVFSLTQGMSYQVTDGASSHRSTTETGATLFIMDGLFLKGDS